MTAVPGLRCEECGGLLVEARALGGVETTGTPEIGSLDYVCIECQRPYAWQGDPPKLVPEGSTN